MLSDFDLLGIARTDDRDLIRAAYRRRVKETHPDVAADGDAFRNHLLFIQITKAYERLLRSSRSGSGRTSPRNPPPDSGGAMVRHKDPAYAHYKAGMDFFMKIHPSRWKQATQRQLETPIPGDAGDQLRMKEKVMELVRLFPKAYYHFSMVVNEYPESDWAHDARVKMNLIEERTSRYKRIIESFGKAPAAIRRSSPP
jgi:hypothetical protein